jgi:hypothetical protein
VRASMGFIDKSMLVKGKSASFESLFPFKLGTQCRLLDLAAFNN